MIKKGWLLYESQDALKNRWFIEKIQSECKAYGLEPELVFTDFITDAYSMNQSNIADELLNQKNTPAFIINRSRNSDIAYELENRGIRIFNPARVSDISNDKDLSYQLVDKLGLPYMSYTVINSEEYLPLCSNEFGYSISGRKEFSCIAKKAEEFGYPFVLKPSDGHGGQNVFLVKNTEEYNNILENNNISNTDVQNNYIFQMPASEIGRDIRVYVVGDMILSAIERTASDGEKDFRANFSLGGTAKEYALNDDELKIAAKVANHIKADFVGIDLIYNNGKPIVNEIEDAVGTRMLYASTDIDPVYEYVSWISRCLE